MLDSRPRTVTPLVQGNVALAPLVSGRGPLGPIASAAWFGARGKLIAQIGCGRRLASATEAD